MNKEIGGMEPLILCGRKRMAKPYPILYTSRYTWFDGYACILSYCNESLEIDLKG